ncbi:MAG: OstA-like protein [Mucilaginibacter sp.]
MKKGLLCFCLLLMAGFAMAQQKKSIVRLIRSERSEGMKRGGKDVVKVYNGTFQQDYSTLSSDSAYFYPQENGFDAFGNVHISQGDTLNIYSDKLNYNGNTKTALLTNNVKLIDKDATLTTDYLTYNTATRIGTYTGGGKLVNKDNVLTSKNGYYFAFSRDAYFRYNVVLDNPEALTKTDTLRYNTGSRISYFYGPTNIYGKEKDKDTLYTENGLYNTAAKQAFFGKKNLYKQGTKSLKGDSLFYDRNKGYGRAVKNITFHDREQKITMKGDLGTYYKKDERAVVTQNAYVVLVTEEEDSTSTDSVAPQQPFNKQEGLVNDSLQNKLINQGAALGQALAAKNKGLTDSLKNRAVNVIATKQLPTQVTKKDSALIDSLKKKVVIPPGGKQLPPSIVKKKITTKPTAKAKTPPQPKTVYIINEKGKRVKIDSVYMSADTLETQILTYKNLKILKEKMRLANVRDTVTRVKKKEPIIYKKAPKYFDNFPPIMRWDTSYLKPLFFGEPVPVKVDSGAIKKAVQIEQQKKAKADSISKLPVKPGKVDSVYLTTKVLLKDTSRVRIINAFHDAKIFKSDLQAKADSMFYANSDSTIRCYVKPMMWTQGSQLSGDTIDLQMKNKKMDNMDIYYNSFIVNVEKKDSLHFNQVGGKKMRGFFKNSKLSLMYVDGNAESIYFNRDSSTNKISGMQRSLSSRMRIRLNNNKVSNLAFLSKPDIRYGPLNKFPEDDRILKNFIWKPKERPVSKEVIINSARRKAANRAAARDEAARAKVQAAKLAVGKAGSDSTSAGGRPRTDSTSTGAQPAAPAKSAAKDDVLIVNPETKDVNRNRITDGTLNTAPVILPAAGSTEQQRDTTTVKAPPAQPVKKD